MARLFVAGSDHVLRHRDELDRINVFPVPDGDTGTNLALTLRTMAEAVRGRAERSVSGVAARLAEAGVLGACGNSGMMLSHFFLGFYEGLDGRARAGAAELAAAIRRASKSLYQAVDKPIEGTILTVVRESSEAVDRVSLDVVDLRTLAERMLTAARCSLERTPELLPVLREANVVDAGAKGFVRLLEGMVGYVQGRPGHSAERSATEADGDGDASASVAFSAVTDEVYRYCTELVLRGDPLPQRQQLAATVRAMGSSVIVNRTDSVAKIHLHTDEPQAVERALAAVVDEVELVKAEDMRAQHHVRRRAAGRRVAIVTDTTCDLPPESIIEHDITVVPLTVMFGDRSYLDQIDIDHDEFLRRLTDPTEPHPTTSQPAPAQLAEAYGRAAEHAGDILGIFVSGAVSGTLGQAQAAATRFTDARVRVLDSRSSSLGLGFLVLRAAELSAEGWEVDEIVPELERLRRRSGLYLTVDTLEYLQRSGRVGKARAFLAGLLDLKPILSVDDSGAIVPVDRARGRRGLEERVLDLLRRQVPRDRDRLRMGLAHVAADEPAARLAEALSAEFAPDELLIRPAAGVLAAHTGPGAWGVFYQAE